MIKRALKLALIFAAFVLAASAIWYTEGIERYMTSRLGPTTGPFVLIGVSALNIVFPQIPIGIFAIAPLAGKLYGPLAGTAYLVLGETLGAGFWYLLGRLLRLNKFNGSFTKLSGYKLVHSQKTLDFNNLFWIGVIRQAPIVPLFLLSLGIGVARMPAKRFLVFMLLANIPIDAFWVLLGLHFSWETFPQVLGFLVLVAGTALLWRRVRGISFRQTLSEIRSALPRLEEV